MIGRIMPGVRVTYALDFPPELIDNVRYHVERNLDILPAWVLSLYVDYDTSQKQGCAAAVEPDVRYRRAALHIAPEWPTDTESYRDEIIVHEFLHAHSWPLVEVCSDGAQIIEESFDAKIVANRLRDAMRTAMEQITTDLTELVMRHIKRGDLAGDDGGAPPPVATGRDGPPDKPSYRRSHAHPDTSTGQTGT
jgi:hypothetical protein